LLSTSEILGSKESELDAFSEQDKIRLIDKRTSSLNFIRICFSLLFGCKEKVYIY